MKTEMDDLTNQELLQLYSSVLVQLGRRGIVRSANNPIGDYTEWLVSTKLGLSLCQNSKAGYDAEDKKGRKYQIKGRRLASKNKSTQLSAIRNLELKQFDYLIAVMFDESFSILYAGQIPYQIVVLQSRYKAYDNSHILYFDRRLLDVPGIANLTSQLTGV